MTFGTESSFVSRALFRKCKFEIDRQSSWIYDTPSGLVASEEL